MARNAFNLSNILGRKISKFTTPKWLEMHVMVEKIFEIYTSQMGRMAIKLSTMVGENFEIYTSQMARMAIKLSTMVGKKLLLKGKNIFHELFHDFFSFFRFSMTFPK